MRSSRPVNLDLFAFSFPITAITSILHRITGVVLFIGLPLLLWALDASLASSTGFHAVTEWLSVPIVKLALWAYFAALLFHLVAGIKHLLMDIGFFETRQSAPKASLGVIVIAAALTIAIGVWLW